MRKTFILISMFLISISSCRKTFSSSEKEVFTIQDFSIQFDNIFTQRENKYYVLVYSPTCAACLSIIDIIKYKKEFNDFTIYFVKFQDIENKVKKDNIGVSNYLDIGVNRVPLLFYIVEGVILDEISGFDNIREYDFLK